MKYHIEEVLKYIGHAIVDDAGNRQAIIYGKEDAQKACDKMNEKDGHEMQKIVIENKKTKKEE